MNKKEVPQDNGVLDHWHNIQYAVDENGKYTLSAEFRLGTSRILPITRLGVLLKRDYPKS